MGPGQHHMLLFKGSQACLRNCLSVCTWCPYNLVQACLNERPSEGLGEVLGGLRGVMEAEALQLNSETKALHDLKV